MQDEMSKSLKPPVQNEVEGEEPEAIESESAVEASADLSDIGGSLKPPVSN